MNSSVSISHSYCDDCFDVLGVAVAIFGVDAVSFHFKWPSIMDCDGTKSRQHFPLITKVARILIIASRSFVSILFHGLVFIAVTSEKMRSTTALLTGVVRHVKA